MLSADPAIVSSFGYDRVGVQRENGIKLEKGER
jgi:hypothetical protein